MHDTKSPRESVVARIGETPGSAADVAAILDDAPRRGQAVEDAPIDDRAIENRTNEITAIADEASAAGTAQRTLGHAISCVGVGRHSGVRVGLTLQPAPPGSGIRFKRSDRPGSAALLASPENLVVVDHALILADGDGTRIVGIELVTAALAMTGIDNALIEVSGPELPAMDGSAQPFVFLIECAGAKRQAAPRRRSAMPAALDLAGGQGTVRLTPTSPGRLTADITGMPAAGRGPARHSVALTAEALRHELPAARRPLTTAALEAAQERGLMRGVSLENTLLLDDGGPRNPGGLRFADEPARHANLLALGALALLGGLPAVELVTRGVSHALLARLLRQCGTSRPASVVTPALGAAAAHPLAGTQA